MSEKSVLIVEDEILIAMEIEERLKSLGYTGINWVLTGEEAVEKAREMTPDLILMDITLGGKMDGVDAFKVIRSQMDIPVLFITGSSERILKERLREAGLADDCDYIIKPYDRDVLREKIAAALGKS